MIIVKLMGGMGNQAFQYAAGRRLAIKHKTILKLDLTFLLDRTPRKNFTYRDYDLSIFNIQENFATDIDLRIFNLKRKFNTSLKLNKNILFVEKTKFKFDPEILKCKKDTYLDGSWQSEKYFKDIEKVIRKDFTFKHDLDYESKKMAEKIKSINAICLNVRRGDYVSNPIASKTHGVCSLDYYHRGIEYIVDRISNPHFLIFSDDIGWCKNNFNIHYPFTIVTHKYAGKKFENYLKLMTLCKYYIIPNSTFGWWAAWLNTNPNKIVIAPKKWLNIDIETVDLLPDNWIKI